MAVTLGVTLRKLGFEVTLKLGTGRHEILQAGVEMSPANFVESSGHDV